MPVIFESEKCKSDVQKELCKQQIYPREYFHPSLETVFSSVIECGIAHDIANRILCLPMSDYLTIEQVERICTIINATCHA